MNHAAPVSPCRLVPPITASDLADVEECTCFDADGGPECDVCQEPHLLRHTGAA